MIQLNNAASTQSRGGGGGGAAVRPAGAALNIMALQAPIDPTSHNCWFGTDTTMQFRKALTKSVRKGKHDDDQV